MTSNSNHNNEYDSSKDPKSINYDRKLVYPKIKWFRILFELIIVLSITSLITFLMCIFSNNIILIISIPILLILLVLTIRLKAFILLLIDLYQLLAPKSLRMNCRFEPSCSEYMKLAIKKYGLFKGLKKGIDRIRRCKPPNGGYDYP